DVRGSKTAQRRDTAMSGTKAVIGRLAVAIALVASVLQPPPAAAEGSPATAGKDQRSFDPAPGPHNSYMRVVVDDPAAVVKKDKTDKPQVMARQKALLESRYDLRNDASGVMLAGGAQRVEA